MKNIEVIGFFSQELSEGTAAQKQRQVEVHK